MSKQLDATFVAGIPGGDEVTVQVTYKSEGVIQKTMWKVIGSTQLIEEAHELQSQIKGAVGDLHLPRGKSFSQLLLKELVLKIKGQWSEAGNTELCHCRNVQQRVVERAILLGADTVEKVRQRTSANTGCGTCRPEVERLLNIYLK